MRRGELVWSEILTMIIIVAAALIVGMWFYMAQQRVWDEKDVELCRLSVEAYARSWVDLPVADAHLFDVDCKRRVVTFTEDGVELNGEELRFWDPDLEKWRTSYGELTPGIVNSVAAAEMATCWYEFLEGQRYWTNEVDIGNDDRACFVCGELHFDGQFTYRATPLFHYLETNQSRPYPPSFARETLPDYYTYLYLEDRVCDESMQDGDAARWPGFHFAYKELFPADSCEQAFFAYLVAEKDWLDNTIRLTPNRSYKVLFFQHGKDKDALGAKGTSYAPLLIPASALSSQLCTTFIG